MPAPSTDKSTETYCIPKVLQRACLASHRLATSSESLAAMASFFIAATPFQYPWGLSRQARCIVFLRLCISSSIFLFIKKDSRKYESLRKRKASAQVRQLQQTRVRLIFAARWVDRSQRTWGHTGAIFFCLDVPGCKASRRSRCR